MIRKAMGILFALVFGVYAQVALAFPGITNVVETGGDNEPTDTITAKWTGVTFNVTVANEPIPGAAIGNPYTVGTFGHLAPAFVDRNHRYIDAPLGTPLAGTVTQFPNGVMIPAYLLGGEYIMSGNDNRDNANYRLDVTIGHPALSAAVFMLIDNRLQDGDNNTPPTFGPANMQWILDEGWIPVMTGNNRFLDPNLPDEVAFDEGATNPPNVDQFYSVYFKSFDAGTFTLRQADNAGRNMYGVVVVPNLIPEPSTFALAILGLAGLAFAARRRNK